ncbi:outer membrane efflux protein [Leptospira fainei serovar Hurstbridge str. BUT 6]|uniref:Outer membrane efflux protein n=1 Tax=Leptospira fainei serovar Hurstbridge str. BUT 6 TaxID=1193011 RepID=S3V108_9LEPT|nr:outer membrane efflux protein [Leptospira fainei serovar Hurstbridge str. BUT 6]
MDLILKERLLQLFRDRESNLERLARTIQNRIGGSGIQPLLLTRAQLAVDSALVDTQIALADTEAARRALALLLGKEGAPNLIPVTKLRDVELEDPPPYEKIIDSIKENFPNLVALRLGIGLAEKQITLAEAQVWDDFTISGGWTRQYGVGVWPNSIPLTSGYPLENGLPGQNSWAFGFNVPIPSLNRNQGSIRKAKVTKQQAEVYYKNAEISLEKDLKGLIISLALNKKIIQQIELSQLPKAQRVLNNQQRLFGTGGANLLEYFDAINAYNATLSTYYKAVADYRKNKARLEAYLNLGIRS